MLLLVVCRCMPTPSAARPQDAARLEGRSGSMHAVPLAAPWRVVSVARPVMVEYKVSATTATTTCLTLWDPARCSHSAPKRAGMGGASAQGYNAPNHADSMRDVQVLIIGDNSYLAIAARSIRALAQVVEGVVPGGGGRVTPFKYLAGR